MSAYRNLPINVLLILTALSYAATVLADTFTEGGDAYKQRDYVTAATKFKEVAAKGDHRAMYALGSMYAGGTGVKQDYQEAFKWFSAAARYGRPDAQYKMGLMYELGVGVKQNYKQAARIYQKTGQQGYAHSQFRLGQLYLQGKGVPADPVKAYAWMIVAKQTFHFTMPASDTEGNDSETILAVDEFQSGDIFANIHLKLIDAELADIKVQLSDAQLQEAQNLAQEISQFH